MGGFFVLGSNYEPHIFHSFAVFGAGGNYVNPCGVYATMT